jgi:Family of unknown function (DUF6931)
MSSRIRFATARSVFEAFPDLDYVATRPQDDSDPLDHAHALIASSRPREALLFLCHLLPRREAVWWAAQCVRALVGEEGETLHAAEIWVRAPEDENRRAALSVANASDRRNPATWLAFAAGWSGGSLLAPDQKPMPAPPGACAMAANTAIMMAVAAGDPRGVVRRMAACAEAGHRFAGGGDLDVPGLKLASQ